MIEGHIDKWEKWHTNAYAVESSDKSPLTVALTRTSKNTYALTHRHADTQAGVLAKMHTNKHTDTKAHRPNLCT